MDENRYSGMIRHALVMMKVGGMCQDERTGNTIV
jgi:hypothetical protein